MSGCGQGGAGRGRSWQEVIAQQRAAVAAEIEAEKNSRNSEVTVFNGCRTAIAAGSYLYAFEVQDYLSIVPGSPIRVKAGPEGRWQSGTVLACENLTVDLSLSEDIGQNVPEARLDTSAWQLLEKLNERLESITPQNRLALELIGGSSLATRRDIHEVKRGQEAAIAAALRNDVTVIWGPPGTGKTYTMASIALEFMQRGQTVLAVSHSNVSVDGIALQVERHMLEQGRGKELSRGRVLRYGEVRSKELASNPNIVSYNYTLTKHPDLERRIRELENLKRRIKSSPKPDMAKFKAAQDEMTKIRKQLKAEEDRYVGHAHFVATTASKLYANALFSGLSFDVVMFDEVSMAYVAQVIAAASYADRHMVFVGDFRQLAPIVQLRGESENKSLLTHDIFDFLGITDDSEAVSEHRAYAHPWLVMLDEQRRMHPEISAFSNQLVYGGMLRDHSSVLAARQSVADSAPFPGHAVTLVDLTGVFCPASNDGKSRYNVVSALVAIGLAIDAVTKGGMKSVAVVAPYKSQVKLLRKVLAAASGKDARLAGIVCSTVHQFQGSERDLVIIDCVEALPTRTSRN